MKSRANARLVDAYDDFEDHEDDYYDPDNETPTTDRVSVTDDSHVRRVDIEPSAVLTVSF